MSNSNNRSGNGEQGENNEEKNNSLTIVDNRTGKKYDINLEQNKFLRAIDLKQIQVDNDISSGVMAFDPGFMNTAVVRSKITYIDGENGILRYRGYAIEDLVENSTFLEVAFLLIYGELPSEKQYEDWTNRIMRHTFLHENLIQLMKTFRYDAHPMGMLISSVSALSTFYEEANPALRGAGIYNDDSVRNKQIFRILGKLPTIAAISFRHRIGRPYNNPVNHLSYTENFLYMMDRLSETDYKPHPKLARALDILFIIHADHELNCSTAGMRHLSSTQVDPYSSVAGSAAALYGPLHGGANEAVLRMLEDIGSVDNIPQFLDEVKQKKRKLMGFGHRVYKNYDPRARILKKVADEVFEVVGSTPLMDVARELEKQALEDEYFIKRRLYPNVDFYSGVIYKAMGFPTDMFPVLFTIPRAAGWIAHWMEQLDDQETKIWRPRQMYTGEEKREMVPRKEREDKVENMSLGTYMSEHAIRRSVSADNHKFSNQ
eukprot:gb/GECH01012078.1/.p1 GENE.gb/GECH01012078.1/~~gb/GECH01012078.1/.p1  ORF type:complete len:488 (+),score=120.62 gb/GECH01012078.1/:1-1464(+)